MQHTLTIIRIFKTSLLRSISLNQYPWKPKKLLFKLRVFSLRHIYPYLILAIRFRPFDLLVPKDFQIIWLSNLFILRVPGEGYYRSVSCSSIRNLCFYYLGLPHLHLLCSYFCKKKNNVAFPTIIYNVINIFGADLIAHCIITTGRTIINWNWSCIQHTVHPRFSVGCVFLDL